MGETLAPVVSDAAVPLARRKDFILGRATVRPSLRRVDGPGGTAKGEPRVMQVLAALADARGHVLSREDLLRQCWNGRIVGDDAINRAIAEVRRIVEAVEGGFEVETVPRVGYRIAGVAWDQSTSPAALPAGRWGDRRQLIVGGAAALAAVALAGAGLVHWRSSRAIDELVERGRQSQATGDPASFRQAERIFREAVRRDRTRADAWGWLAAVAEDNKEAQEAAQRAVRLDPREPNGRTVLAFLRRDLDSWTQWEDALLAILANAPETVAALSHLTFFYQGMGRCADSWATNERALLIEPFNASFQSRRALKHWIFGRLTEADRVADSALELRPRDPSAWNARMLIYACTGRAPAALALLDDVASRPWNMTVPNVESWRAGLTAIASRSRADIAHAVAACTAAAPFAPGLAANAIMLLSHLGELDAAYRVAHGLFENQGSVVQRMRGKGIRDFYSGTAWGRTQFLFVPACAPFRADARFPDLCRRLGHVAYWRRRGIWPDSFVRGAIEPAKLA